MTAFVYILCCRGGSYYVGSARGDLDRRVAEHNAGKHDGYTARRRPVELVFHQEFDRITDAVAAERQIKGWRRAKKEALMRGDFALLSQLAKRGKRRASFDPSRRPFGPPQDEVEGGGSSG